MKTPGDAGGSTPTATTTGELGNMVEAPQNTQEQNAAFVQQPSVAISVQNAEKKEAN